MELNELVASIPSLVSSVFDLIVIIDNNDNSFSSVDYNGEKIKVASKKSLNELSQIIKNNEIIKVVNKKEDTKTYVDNIFAMVKNVSNYQIVFVTFLEEKKIDANKKVILIADDSPVITNFFTKTFQDEFEVLVARDGVEAIDLVEKNKFRLLAAFFDLQMPNKNGFEVLDYFQENDLFKEIPVSIISGEDSKDGIDKATSIPGVIDMLQKPFNADSAKAIVNKTISFSPKYKEF